MAYQGGYSNNSYAQNNPYAQQNAPQSNPYAQQGGGYGGPQSGGYGLPSRPQAQQNNSGYGQQQSAGYGQSQQGGYGQGGGGGYEMSNMNGGASSNPNNILEECREIDRAIDGVEARLEQLKGLQSQALNETDVSSNSPVARQIEGLMQDIETSYRSLLNRMKSIKSKPASQEARNAPQIGRVDRRLKDAVQRNMQIRRDYEIRCKEQFERNYRIVRPQASEAEVREAAEDPNNTQVFSQAMLQSDRRGQAQSALSAVRSRHEAIQKVERDIIQLAQLFEDMNQAVMIQETQVANIEQKGEEVHDNVQKGNIELDGAVKSARAARKKKWLCLGLVLLIIIIIVIVVVVVVKVTGVGGSNNNNAKTN